MPSSIPGAGTPAWAAAIAAALVLLIPIVCWAALQVNATYVKIMDDHSHMRSSLHTLINQSTAISGQLELTKRLAQDNHNAVQTLAGGGAALAIEPIAQADAQLPAGGVDPQWANDCGETCVAMLVAAKKGVPIGVARVRYLLRGPSGDARTTADDLVSVLAMCHLAAHARNTTVDTCILEVKRNLDAGRSSIVLGDWITKGYAHWMEAVQYTGDGIVFNDPWIGARRMETWQSFRDKYDGQYVHLDV